MTIIDEGVKDALKKSILLAFCFVLCGCLLVSCSEENQTTSENDYELYMSEVRYSSQHMPDIEELGNYEDIVIKTKTTTHGLAWNVDTISLMVTYCEETFETELQRVMAEYQFVSGVEGKLYDFEADVKGNDIRVVKKQQGYSDEYTYGYPEAFMMIGINEEKNSIVYMFHYDIDLDEINDLDSFIQKYYML